MSTSNTLVNSYLPCHYKSSFETTAKQQLLYVSRNQQSRPNSGDSRSMTYCGEKKSYKITPSSYQSQRTGKLAKSDNDLDLGKGQNCNLEVSEVSAKESGDCRLSMFDVFLKLSSRDAEFGFGRGFGCWNICPQGHINSVLHNLKDPPKELAATLHTQYQKPASANSHKQRNITSATGRLHEVQSTSTVTKRRTTCKSAKCTSRSSSRASSALEEKDSTLWADSPPAYPIDYKFKHSRHSKQHADRYRELYTYTKIRDRLNSQTKSGMTIPRARLVCVDAQESGFRGMALGGKSASTTATSDYDYYVPEAGMKGGVKWYMCQRLHDNCDPKLSVNNPSPTEIAMFCKVPAVKRSSPSIPSNTNGKYGGKGTDKPYPFQLNISAANKTVRAPVKRLTS